MKLERLKTMPEQWNRKKRRQMSRYGLGEEEMQKRLSETWNKAEEATYRTAFSGMILALVEEFSFDPERLRDLAVATMSRINGADCASQLVDRCKAVTGYDVDEPLDEFQFVEIGVD